MTAAATGTERSHLWSAPDTTCPDGEQRDRALVQELVQLLEDTRALGGVVFGRDGLHLARAGMDQVQAERATAALNGLHLFSREAGRQHKRGEVETVLVRYQSGAVVIAPLTDEVTAALVVDDAVSLRETARALTLFAGSVQHLLPRQPCPFIHQASGDEGRG
ncbi:roadblock/LC7 domain-containing protein [Nocardiopsis deserti]|uniref:roadblock/LC7 domain-containing protein n=1 Tax=Nocardiopsis deserti TaxID=2605988 RepID=UPI00123B1586|nr:roadblock/LC7 domain-containing protein [Nocardiopsis deserti]